MIALRFLEPVYSKFIFCLDFLVVYFFVYKLLAWLKKTQSFRVIKGFLFLLVFFLLSYALKLTTISWLLGKFATFFIIVVIIIFQPELRRFLERIGNLGLIFSPDLAYSEGQRVSIVKQILRAVENLSKEKIGALIVVEVGSNLDGYIESGIKIHGEITSDLLSSLFWAGSATHDGAVIIRGNKIAAAGCFLPLTEKTFTDRRLGTRHRAAMGLSEMTDAIVIVVSEETGIISLVEKEQMTRYLNKEALETRLFSLYKEKTTEKVTGK